MFAVIGAIVVPDAAGTTSGKLAVKSQVTREVSMPGVPGYTPRTLPFAPTVMPLESMVLLPIDT